MDHSSIIAYRHRAGAATTSQILESLEPLFGYKIGIHGVYIMMIYEAKAFYNNLTGVHDHVHRLDF